MFSHLMVGSNDLARSRKFYDALSCAVGGRPGVGDAKGRLVYAHESSLFLVTVPLDGRAAMPANGGTVGLTMKSPAHVDAWHKAGIENGGMTIEEAPGVRDGSQYYRAYLRDPDGNKLCALHRME